MVKKYVQPAQRRAIVRNETETAEELLGWNLGAPKKAVKGIRHAGGYTDIGCMYT
jgi:hypothetical protein